ncbi:MAG: HAMP domain-containing sensor histidine kinase [Candidatus Promineifilaceae bacterium]
MKKSLSIRVYLGLSHALLLAISLGVIGFIWSQNEYQVITGELQGLMRQRIFLLADIVSHEIREHDTFTVGRVEFPVLELDEDLLAVYFNNSDVMYELVPGTVSPSLGELFRRLKSEHSVDNDGYVTLIHSEFESTSIYVSTPVVDAQNQVIGTVCMLMPIGYLDAFIMRQRLVLIGAIGIVMLLGVGVSLILNRFFTDQFSRAQKLAASVANGNYEIRIPEEGPSELRDLSHYLNQMADELQEELKMRQTLLANVVHELARPLAGLQLGIESLRKGAIQDSELADDMLVNMGQTIRRLEDLIDDITLAARPERNPIQLQCMALSVEPFLRGVATRYWSRANSRELKLDVRVEADLPPVLADEKRLNQIIGNLMDNAIKFTPPGMTIHLSAERAGDAKISFQVHDGGQGISVKETNRLFEPFYQGDVGRRVKQGMGLGLPIARQLALAHGGSLTLENDPEGGTLATLILPTADA